jgi:hypothetical protein
MSLVKGHMGELHTAPTSTLPVFKGTGWKLLRISATIGAFAGAAGLWLWSEGESLTTVMLLGGLFGLVSGIVMVESELFVGITYIGAFLGLALGVSDLAEKVPDLKAFAVKVTVGVIIGLAIGIASQKLVRKPR